MAREVLKVEIEGLKPFLKKLQRIEKKSRRRAILKSAMQAGTSPLKKQLRREISSADAIRKGHLRKAVASTVRVYRSGVAVIMTGIRHRKLPDGENPGNYFHLVDLGVKEHPQRTRPIYIEAVDGYRQMRLTGTGTQGYVHPGHYGEIMKYKAEQAAWPKVADAVMEKLDKGITKELTRG